MTLEEKDILNERIDAAIQSLDADYLRAQNQAAIARERYYQMRTLADNYHRQRMILLEAQGKLWNDEEELF